MVDRRGREWPVWLDLVETPGVLDVLTVLHRHGPCDYAPLCSAMASGRDRGTTSSAVRLLVVHRLLRRNRGAGSLDNPETGTQWELTASGHEFAHLYDQLVRLIAAHHPDDNPRNWEGR